MTRYDPRDDARKSYDVAIEAMRERFQHLYEAGAKRVYQVGDCVLIQGDCLEIMPALEKFDAVVTDPPYGVGDSVGSGLKKNRAGKSSYSVYKDTSDNFYSLIIPRVRVAIGLAERAALTCGFKRIYDYPRPLHVGSFQYTGTTVMSSWGPSLWQPILYYGKDPHVSKLVPDSFQFCNDVDRVTEHPCPKPLVSWSKLVNRASLKGEAILDPFMGSGTTGVACVQLGRKFTGIELDPDYFDIAVRRIEEAYRQPSLFPAEKPKPAKTLNMFEEGAA